MTQPLSKDFMLLRNQRLHKKVGQQVIALEAEALRKLCEMISDEFDAAVDAIVACKQRIVVSGVGKSGHIARKIAATFAATGTPAQFVHAADTAHGDVGMVVSGDVLLVFSNSGDTAELLPLYDHVRRLGVTLIGVSRNWNSLLMRMADIGLLLPQVPEACAASMAPTTSSTMMLALGDALAVAAMNARGLSSDDIRALHPGGAIGRGRPKVKDVMHCGDRLPLVKTGTPMIQVLAAMSEKRLGMTGVVDLDGKLVGVVTDGDLRRHLDDAAPMDDKEVTAIMTSSPKCIEQNATVADALEMMRAHRITVLFVVPEPGSLEPIGAIQIYDIAAGST